MFTVITQHRDANEVVCSECKYKFTINVEYGNQDGTIKFEGDTMIFVCPSCNHESTSIKMTDETKRFKTPVEVV